MKLTSPGGTILTVRLDLDEDVKGGLSGGECHNPYPTLGGSGKLVYLISGSRITIKYQLSHRLLGGPVVNWWNLGARWASDQVT